MTQTAPLLTYHALVGLADGRDEVRTVRATSSEAALRAVWAARPDARDVVVYLGLNL